MIQRGADFRLALEAKQPFGIAGKGLGQELQRDIAIELRVARAIDLTHPAHADAGDDFIGTEACAGRQGQM